jgi:hypothetical protein
MVKKFIENGMVAVLYSPSYGTGWNAYQDEAGALDKMYDPEIVLWILHGHSEILLDALLQKYPRESKRSFTELTLAWVPVGKKFRIEDYDGYESIVFPEDETWLTA